ncbi:MAG TPA: MFS transporter [Thermoplasmata archaeon]|nr:MFS transporter [Thermoplasmata archaeon]
MATAPQRGWLLPVYLTTVLWSASVALIGVPLAFQVQRLGIPVFQYGVLLGLVALGMLLTETYWGAVAHRLEDPRRLVGIGAVVIAATLALGFARGFLLLAIAEFTVGAVGVYLAPLVRLAGIRGAGATNEARATGRIGTAFGVGLTLGTAAGPVLFVTGGFWWDVIASAAVFAVCLGTAVTIRWPNSTGSHPEHGVTTTLRHVVSRHFTAVSALVFVEFLLISFVTNFLQYYSVDLFGATPTQAGYVLGAVRFTSMGVSYALGSTIDRRGVARSVPIGFVLLLVGLGGSWLAPNLPLMAAASVVFGVGLGWLNAALLPLALARIPGPNRGAAIGLFGSVEDLGLLVGPLLIGGLWSILGEASSFPYVVGLAGVGAIAALAVSRSSGVHAVSGDLDGSD